MRLRYTPQALVELDEILTAIAEQSRQGAARVQNRIRTILGLLVAHPQSGQLTSLQPMRRIVVTPYPYLIFYETVGGEVVIIGIRHSARNPNSMPDQS